MTKTAEEILKNKAAITDAELTEWKEFLCICPFMLYTDILAAMKEVAAIAFQAGVNYYAPSEAGGRFVPPPNKEEFLKTLFPAC